MFRPIVATSEPVILVGGASLEPDDLNISLRVAPIIVAADGGADHLLAQNHAVAAVIGDLDSISEAAKRAYQGVLHQITDQETTDFEKALSCIDAPLILAHGFMGGRLDHQLAVLNCLVRFRDKRVVLVGPDDVVFVAPAKTTLSVPYGTRIALLPFGDARVQSRGLRWDIADAAMQVSGMISSSNETVAEKVTIHAMGQLLITLPRAHLDAAIAAVRAG